MSSSVQSQGAGVPGSPPSQPAQGTEIHLSRAALDEWQECFAYHDSDRDGILRGEELPGVCAIYVD